MELLWTNQVKPVFPGLVNKVLERERESCLKPHCLGNFGGHFQIYKIIKKLLWGTTTIQKKKTKMT